MATPSEKKIDTTIHYMSPDGCTNTTSKIALPFTQKKQALITASLFINQFTGNTVDRGTCYMTL